MKILTYIIDEFFFWVEAFFCNCPGRIGGLLRRLYWSGKFKRCISISISYGCVITVPKNISIGSKVVLMNNCYLYAHENGRIKIQDRVHINSNVMLGAADNAEIVIGNDVLIGSNVVIRASNHRFCDKNTPINQQGHTGGKIVIEDDVWIGANVVILPDVTIGKGAVIAGGAVVDRSIPSYALAGGVPAKVIKENARI